MFTCISCGWTKPVDQMNAGHFFGTKKFNWMRFLEDNCNGECISCNNFNHESLIGYTLNLPEKIGQERFNNLIRISKEKQTEFLRDELEKLIDKYKMASRSQEKASETLK